MEMTRGNKRLFGAIVAALAVGSAYAATGLPPETCPEHVGRKIVEHFLTTEPDDFHPQGYTGGRMRFGYVFYAVGSMWVNAMEMARTLGDASLEKRLVDKFLPFHDEKKGLLAPPYHVDTTVFGAVPYEVYLLTGDKRALEMGAAYADKQWDELSDEDVRRMAEVNSEMSGHLLPRDRRDDLLRRGYSPQTRLWIDDMYMISFLQTQAYRATEDRKYIDRTAKEMVLYLDELQLRDGPNAGLFYHAPDVPFVWGRGDGWMAGGLVLVLKYLPLDSPYRPRILEGYRKMMVALLKEQRPDGLWGQLIDDPESWSETSGSAMFTYAFIEGVKNGWLSAETYGPAARRAWTALCGRIDELGNTRETCVGTGKKNDRQYYLDRPRITGDPHGQMAMLWCVNALIGTKLTISSSLAAEAAGIRDFLATSRKGILPPVRKDIPDEAHGKFELVNRKADGFRCIWDYNQYTGDEFVYKYSGGIGVYCEGHVPMAVYSKEANKTFFCYGGTDSRNSTLLHAVSSFDHATGKLARPTIVFDKHTQDAHDNPVINLDDKGYIYIFASSHGITRPSAIARSERPFDISRFKVIWEGNYSYPQPFYFPGKGFLWLQTRYTPKEGVWQWRWPRTSCFMTSDTEVTSWSPCATLQLFNEGHYQRAWPFGTEKVGVVFDQHPEGKGLNWRTDVFYMESADFGKTWRTAAGEPLEVPVSCRETPALAIPYAEKSRNVYIKGLKFDTEGRPVVLYIVSKGFKPGPEDGPREWKIAKWTGQAWREVDTGIRSGSNYDFAELYVEGERDWRILGASEIGPQPYNCGGEIAAWISHDAGEMWSLEKKLTAGSERNHNYPRQPLNVNPGFYAFWADGHGRKPSVSRLYFCDKALNVYMMPLSFDGDFADPVPYRPGAQAEKPVLQPFKDGDRVAFYGDSITRNGMAVTRTAAYYRKAFPERNVRFFNVGISGGGVPSAHIFFDKSLAPLRPTHVVLAFGVNDAGESISDDAVARFESEYERLIDRIQAAGATVVLRTPTPFGDVSSGRSAAHGRVAESVRRIARKRALALVDDHALFGGRMAAGADLFVGDNVHPNERGQWQLSEDLLAAQGLRTGEFRPFEEVASEAGLSAWHEAATRLSYIISAEWLILKGESYPLDEGLAKVGKWLNDNEGKGGVNPAMLKFAREYLRLKPREAELRVLEEETFTSE